MFLRQVCLDGAEVVVVGEAVEVDEHLDAVALVNEARHEVLPRQLLVGLQLDPRGLQRVEFGVEEGLADADLEDKDPAEERLLQIHRLGLRLGRLARGVSPPRPGPALLPRQRGPGPPAGPRLQVYQHEAEGLQILGVLLQQDMSAMVDDIRNNLKYKQN